MVSYVAGLPSRLLRRTKISGVFVITGIGPSVISDLVGLSPFRDIGGMFGFCVPG